MRSLSALWTQAFRMRSWTPQRSSARGAGRFCLPGTAGKEAETFFKITVQPEKEMVMILVPREIKDDILHALYRSVGLKTPAQGIAFSLPVDSVVGLSAPNAAEDHAREE